ncbi:MAG: ATP-binding cassette domain-containing protein, partial [Bdellovibrionota bacterium]|nr:ATP-binding cassette domain-containing protein [Bdellovibrionota bacterium]
MSYSCHSIKKSYHQGEKEISILRGIDFDWKEEKIVGIVGESGSGKSTLLSIFSGLLRPNAGEVVIDNTSLYKLDKKRLSEFRAKNIGIIFQQYHLIPDLTLTENILLPL